LAPQYHGPFDCRDNEFVRWQTGSTFVLSIHKTQRFKLRRDEMAPVTAGHGALTLALSIFCSTVAIAQSLDPKSPAALAAGVNKGNVDNMTGAHYYYFWAGPGHFDIRLSFKDLGLFGNPLRQPLNFEFYDDGGTLLARNVIVAAGPIERLSTTGDLTKHERIRLSVIPKAGAIRLGGYYEIEVTGSVELTGKPGATEGVAPVDNSLVRNGGTSLVRPGQRLIGPTPPR
jgi:hypothetical protein